MKGESEVGQRDALAPPVGDRPREREAAAIEVDGAAGVPARLVGRREVQEAARLGLPVAQVAADRETALVVGDRLGMVAPCGVREREVAQCAPLARTVPELARQLEVARERLRRRGPVATEVADAAQRLERVRLRARVAGGLRERQASRQHLDRPRIRAEVVVGDAQLPQDGRLEGAVAEILRDDERRREQVGGARVVLGLERQVAEVPERRALVVAVLLGAGPREQLPIGGSGARGIAGRAVGLRELRQDARLGVAVADLARDRQRAGQRVLRIGRAAGADRDRADVRQRVALAASVAEPAIEPDRLLQGSQRLVVPSAAELVSRLDHRAIRALTDLRRRLRADGARDHQHEDREEARAQDRWTRRDVAHMLRRGDIIAGGMRTTAPVTARAWAATVVVYAVGACLVALLSTASAQPLSAEKFGLGLISEERTRAEEAVKQLRQKHPAGTTPDAEAWKLYTDAQAGFNQYIDRLKFALILGENLARPEAQGQYRKALDAAAARNAAFLAHVDRATAQATRGGIVSEIGTALFQGGVEIWKEWARQSQAQRQQLLEALEGLKFKSFTDVK